MPKIACSFDLGFRLFGRPEDEVCHFVTLRSVVSFICNFPFFFDEKFDKLYFNTTKIKTRM